MDTKIQILLTAVDQLSGPLGRAERTLDSFGAKAQTIGRALEGLGTRIGGLGLATQGGLAQIGLDMRSLVSGAVEAEKALYGIASTAGLSGAKARAMVGEWSIAVNQLAVATNQAQADVTAAFGAMVSKGMDPTQAIAMLKPIGQAATAAQADILDMATAMEASFSKMGLNASQAGKALDIMAQAGKAGAFELKDMAGYFEALTAKARSLGIAGESGLAQLSAAAQIARRSSGDAASAATNLGNFLDKLNAQVTYKNFERMGVDLAKLKEEAQASGNYILYMAEAIQKLTGGDTAKIAALFPDIQAGQFIQGLVKDVKDFETIFQGSMAANGVAAEDFQTQMDSTSSALKAMQITGTDVAQNSGALKDLVGTLKDVSQWVADNPDTAKYLIFGSAAAVVGGAVIVGIGATVTAIGTLVGAMGTISAFLATHPMVATLLGLAAAGTAGYVAGGYIADWIDEQIAALTGEKGQTLGGLLYDMIEGPNGIVTRLKSLPSALDALAADWKQAGANLIQALKDGIAERLKGSLGIGQKITDAVAWLDSQSKEWIKIGGNIVDGIILGIKQKVAELWSEVRALGTGALKSIKDALGIRSPSREMMAVGRYAGEGLVIGIQNSAKDVDRAAEKLGQSVIRAASAGVRDSKGRFLPADEAKRAAEAWRRNADDINRSLTDALFRAFEHGKGFAQAFRETLINAFKTMVLKPVVQAIIAPVGGAVASAFSGQAMAGAGGGGGSLGAQTQGALQSASTLSSLNAMLTGSFGASAFGASEALGNWLVTNTSGAMNQAGMSLLNGGSSAIASGASMLGGALVGFIAGKMISGGYSAVGKSGNTAVIVGTTIGAMVGGPIGAAIGGALGGMVNRAFGMKTKEVSADGISGTFAAGDFSGQEWVDWTQKGGWFRKSKSGTDVSALNYAVDTALSGNFAALQAQIGGFALALGQSADQVLSYTKSINLNLHGLDAAAREAKINDIFRGMANDMAALAMGTTRFTRAGEGAADALTRLVTHLSGVNSALALIGQNAFAATLSGAAMANELADMAGGLDAFTKLSATYYQNFYSESERFDNAVGAMRDALINIGVNAMPQSIAQFRSLMEAQDLTTVSGRATYAALITVSEGFAALVNDINSKLGALEAERLRIAQAVIGERDGLDQRLATLLGRTAELRAAELAKIDPLNRALFMQVRALQDAASAQAAYNDQLSALANAGSGIRAFINALRAGLTGGASGGSLPAARQAYADDLARARLGDVNASGAITGSAGAYLEALQATAKSRTEYDIAVTRIANELEALPATKGYAQQQAESLAALITQGDSLQALLTDLNTALADAVASGFSGLDLNLDGLLTFDELKQGLGGLATDAQIASLIKSVDLNGDGQISATEEVKSATDNVDANTYGLLDASTDQISAMRKLVAETITNSGNLLTINTTMAALKDVLTEMTEQEKTKAAIANKNLALEALLKQREGGIAAVYANTPTAIRPGETSDAVWESIISPSWNAHVAKYGIGWDTSRTSPTELESQMNALRTGYQQIKLQEVSNLYDAAIEAARQAIRDLGGIPQFAVGTNYVPSDMVAQIHEGERIIPAADNRALMDALQSPARREAVLIAEVQKLRAEVAAMRAETAATARNTAKTARQLDRAMPDGDAIATRTAA